MLDTIFLIVLQIAGFVFLARLGGKVSDRLAVYSKWAPLAVAGVIFAVTLLAVLIFNPAVTGTVQFFGLWLVAFAGGIVVRSRQREFPDSM